MTKMQKWKPALFMLLSACIMTACSDDEAGELMGDPDFTFNSDTGEYQVKLGREVKLSAHVTNATDAYYTWKHDGKIVGTDTVYMFPGRQLGEKFVNFRVDAGNGSVEKQVKVTVVDKLPPKITISSSSVAYCDQAMELAAEAQYTDGTTTFEWSYEGEVVSRDSIYVFKQKEIDIYSVALKVTNEDGVDVKNVNISVIPDEEPMIFFDNGEYVLPSEIREKKARTMTCPIGKNLVLAPVRFGIGDKAVYEWTVDGSVQSETSLFFNFTPSVQGKIYEIGVTAIDGNKTASTVVKVQCTEPENTFFRETTDKSSYISNHCFSFIPAPGQFISFNQNQTAEDARRQIQAALDRGAGEGGYLASLGAWGGYFILGFDHSVKNNHDGEPDFDMTGNPLGKYWCECGVVWVSQDENGNGIADDTWYELKGSETGKPGIVQRYALKYYRPTKEKTDVLSIDNDGNLTFLRRNAYHPESGYYPWFMKEEYYILTGTCLGNQFTTEGLELNWGFDWGYVDNINDPTGFRIDNAIQQDGSPAKLEYIDFVKCHTAQMGQGAAVGEVSTESSAAIDVRLRAKRK